MSFIKLTLNPYEITLHLKSDWFFSFGDSPYYAHYNGSAIDLYEGKRGFEGDQTAIAPFSGKVIFIKKVNTPKRRGFSSEDYLVGIIPEENESLVIRILHIWPKVNKGERIDVGDQIGYFIKSGFFNPWTDPHLHLEVRKDLAQFLIARGALPIIRKHEITLLVEKNVIQGFHNTFILEVDQISCNYILAKPKYVKSFLNFNNVQLYGLPLFKGYPNLLDAGIPYYKRGLLLFPKIFNGNNNSKLVYDLIYSEEVTFKIFDNDVEYHVFRGIGTALYPSLKNLHIKLVPRSSKSGNFLIQEGDVLTLKLNYNGKLSF
ncbi:MAG: hypothetical protein ACP6IS_03255 [Candidatus Asgardarchaeia archaeon]